MSGRVVVSVHDVAPSTSTLVEELVELVEDHGLIATLLVVPGPWNGQQLKSDDEFGRWLTRCAENGHEISLHGWEHSEPDDAGLTLRTFVARVIARGCAEFAGLTRDVARSRLIQGREALRAAGHDVAGFTPPGWLASRPARDAVAALGFAYSTSQRAVFDHRSGVVHRIPAFCQRPNSSVTALGSALVRRAVVSRVATGRDVRIALHPQDLSTPALRHETVTLLQVASTAVSFTYRELVDDLLVGMQSSTYERAA